MRNVWNVMYSLVPPVWKTFEWKKVILEGLGGNFPARNLVILCSLQWDSNVTLKKSTFKWSVLNTSLPVKVVFACLYPK